MLSQNLIQLKMPYISGNLSYRTPECRIAQRQPGTRTEIYIEGLRGIYAAEGRWQGIALGRIEIVGFGVPAQKTVQSDEDDRLGRMR
jgi:hypothetical protein